MKKLIILALIFSFIPLVFAADLKVEQTESDYLIIKELDNSATFTLDIINKEDIGDNFKIYSLVGASIIPKETFYINSGAKKELEIEVTPHKKTKKDTNGYYSLDYQIKAEQTGYFSGRLALKIIELKNALSFEINNIRVGDKEAEIIINNLEEFEFEEIQITLKSDFFETTKISTINSESRIELTVPINLDKIKTLEASEYDVEIVMEFKDVKTKTTTTLNYLEKGDVSVTKESSGFIVKRNSISKTNEGNIAVTVEINSKKNVLSRLFTTYSENPYASERKGLFVEYSWEKELLPTETYSINSTTNYTLPFIFLLIIGIVFFVTKFLIRKDLSIRKRVSFVKTKGGEFALKVKLKAKANNSIENIEIHDRIPQMTKLYEKFGAKPDKIDKGKRKISWNIKRLNASEERVFTYIIYSKINVLGRFELPSASAKYEKNGKHEQVFSNKTYFAAESSEHE